MKPCYTCPQSCLGLFADVNEYPVDKEIRENVEKLQKEYQDYKSSFGQPIPFNIIIQDGSPNRRK